MAKLTEAQKRANKAYRERNREKTRIISLRSSARTFIRKYSDIDDLNELKELIKKRENELKEAE